MSDERKRAAEKEVAQKILETVGELENLLGGGSPSTPMDPREEAFWATAMRFEEELQAKAGIFEELIDIVLPQVKLFAVPLRNMSSAGDPRQVAELEALFGTFDAKARGAEWLDGVGLVLEGGIGGFAERLRKSREGEGGFQEGSRLFLRSDGQLVVVRCAGVWRVQGGELTSSNIIVEAQEVTPLEAVRRFSFQFILTSLRGCLTQDYAFLKDRHVPDRAERLERFDALAAEFGAALSEYVTRLRRVGDSPA